MNPEPLNPEALLPEIALTIDGAPAAALEPAVLKIEVRQRLSVPDLLIVTALAGAEGTEDLPAMDAEITVRIGKDTLFDGTVTAVERRWSGHGYRAVAIRAYDALHHTRLQRRTNSFAGASLADVLSEVANRAGLQLDDQTGRSHQTRQHFQYGETDLALIRRLIDRTGLAVRAEEDRLVVFEASGYGSPLGLTFGEDLVDLTVDTRTDLDSDETVIGWHEAKAGPVTSGKGRSQHGGWWVDDASATEIETGLAVRRATQQLVAAGVAIGNPGIKPGARLDLRTEQSIEGTPAVSSATHTITAEDGYLTEFSTETLLSLPKPGPHSSTVGRIVDLDDPDGRGRVRVALLAFDEIETDWLAIIGPGVGQDRGVVAVPDVDDHVLVLGPADNVGGGVVLGGIAADDALIGPPIEGAKNRRIIARIPEGPQVVLEDDGVLIEDGEDTRLEFRKDKVTLHASADLEISAPGRRLVFQADSIDFEQR